MMMKQTFAQMQSTKFDVGCRVSHSVSLQPVEIGQ